MSSEERDDEPTPAEIQQVSSRYDALKLVALAVPIASLWIPLQAVLPIAKVLAGKHTSVTITISISVVITLSIGAGYAALWRKSRAQRGEIVRLRGRVGQLETELRAAKGD